ncbi:MAG: PKD domain-containing protein, partial [Bacteroidota bacterium]
GSLLASTGDGGPDFQPQFSGDFHIFQALEEGITTEQEHVGPFRAQLLQCLNGKILRLDPNTGDGLPDNPWYESDNPRSAQSRVWTLGVRNPFRMTVIPGTGEHEAGQGNPGIIVFGDVGEGQWEEINFIDQPGLNCGWPIYEGYWKTWTWSNTIRQNQYAPNPLSNSGDCEKPFFDFQDLLLPASKDGIYNWKNPCDDNQLISDQIPRFHHHLPVIDYSHLLWNQPTRARTAYFGEGNSRQLSELANPDSPISGQNFDGFSALAGFWYEDGLLPEDYNRSYWIADYSGWIKILKLDESFQVTQVDTFVQFDHDLVDLAFNPKNQSIYFTDIVRGRLYRIAYGLNPPPIPVVAEDTIWGNSPLTVQFDASASYHPKNVPFTYSWDFGDGQSASTANPNHIFEVNGNSSTSFKVKLVLTDSIGMTAEKELLVSINNSPPIVEITSVRDGDVYPISATTALRLEAEVDDVESSNEELGYTWQTFLHHNAHFHPEPIDLNPVTHTLISPLGCQSELYYFRIRLRVTDPQGLSTDDEVTIFPNCDATGIELDLKAEGQPTSILLSWPMEEVSGLQDITVQRVTAQIEEWNIGTVDIDGTGAYTFEDSSPTQGINQYRLRLNYTDGTYDYSNFVSQIFPTPPLVSLFPNPAQDRINVQITDINGEALSWRLSTLDGKLLATGQFPIPEVDFINDQIDVSKLQNGAYLLEFTVGERSYTEKILILR